MTNFQALQVRADDSDYAAEVKTFDVIDLPPGEVLIKVHGSALNYKDALAITGRPGIVKAYPHVPGIDAAGTVVESAVERYKTGQRVIVTGWGLGERHWGGLSEFIRVPADWLVPCPEALSLRDAMALGTAGLTAGVCVDSLLQVGLTPERGPILVSGATGGVGSIAVMLLQKLGFDVSAITGRPEAAGSFLKELGVNQIVPVDDALSDQQKPMLSQRWSGGIDAVGGETLSFMLKSIQYGGSVACCGMAASAELNTSLFPFILRGINLLGVDSVELPYEVRVSIWEQLANEWNLAQLSSKVKIIKLNDVAYYADALLNRKSVGRLVVDLASD